MTAMELDDWAQHFHTHGFWRDNQQYLLAQKCALFYNANRGKRQKARAPADFYLIPPKRKPETVDTMIDKLKRMFTMLRG